MRRPTSCSPGRSTRWWWCAQTWCRYEIRMVAALGAPPLLHIATLRHPPHLQMAHMFVGSQFLGAERVEVIPRIFKLPTQLVHLQDVHVSDLGIHILRLF